MNLYVKISVEQLNNDCRKWDISPVCVNEISHTTNFVLNVNDVGGEILTGSIIKFIQQDTKRPKIFTLYHMNIIKYNMSLYLK